MALYFGLLITYPRYGNDMFDISAYDFELPHDLIAQSPLHRRSDSRLLVVRRQSETIEHAHIRDLPEILDKGDHLVLNDTRVVPARLVGRRSMTGGRWEGLFITSDEEGTWKLLSKTRGHLRPGETVTIDNGPGETSLQLRMLIKLEDGMWAARPEDNRDTFDLLEEFGRVPLPPYIRKGEMVESDRERYQTVFASEPGAVAAPTAGLHFTNELLERLGGEGIDHSRVTLHVGIGTFRPMAVDDIRDHVMHEEWGQINDSTAQQIENQRAAGGRCVAVGTTSVRVLETAARSGKLAAWTGQTDLFISPGFEFHAVDALLTNFHLPKSSLLVLVRTFGGDALLRRAYAEAVEAEYRFFSYGDAMLIL